MVQSPAPKSYVISQWVNLHWHRSQATHQPVIMTANEMLWQAHESPRLWQVSHHDFGKCVIITLVSNARNSGMLLTKGIYNDYLIHLLTLYITIITHILYRDNCPSHLFKVVCHGVDGPIQAHYTCLLWCCMHQLWNYNIEFFCFNTRSRVLPTLPMWNEINNLNYFKFFLYMEYIFKAYSKNWCMS